MSEIFEALMLICLGISWAVNVIKSIKAKTAKNKSPVFLLLVLLAYTCGAVSKIAAQHITYVFYIYIVNILLVSADILLFIRNKSLDKKAGIIKSR